MKTNLTESMVANLEIDELCLRLGDHDDEVVRGFVARVEREFISFDEQLAEKDEEVTNAWDEHAKSEEQAKRKDLEIAALKLEIDRIEQKLEAKA